MADQTNRLIRLAFNSLTRLNHIYKSVVVIRFSFCVLHRLPLLLETMTQREGGKYLAVHLTSASGVLALI